MQVLKELPWDEQAVSDETQEIFLNKHVEGCKVFAWLDRVSVVLELVCRDSGLSTLMHLSGQNFDDPEHYICHAFLSDAASGNAINAFPKDQKITAVCRVSRTETSRRWSVGGYILSKGCQVSGIKFSFEKGASDAQNTQDTKCLEIILHCWAQCKQIPFCGGPMSAIPANTLLVAF